MPLQAFYLFECRQVDSRAFCPSVLIPLCRQVRSARLKTEESVLCFVGLVVQ